MTLIRQINWRYLATNIIASWFMLASTEILSLLSNKKILRIADTPTEVTIQQRITDAGVSMEEISDYLYYQALSGFVGLVLGMLISIFVCYRIGARWVNPLLLIVCWFILNWFLRPGNFFKSLVYYPGQLGNNASQRAIIQGSLLILIAIIMFFTPTFLRSRKPMA